MTPPEVACVYGVKPATVIGWIRAGELRAIDIARRGAKRPRYRIDPADLAVFENGRAVEAPTKPKRRSTKRQDVIEFF